MFLVTYNFGDMPVNHMTFLRHRIFLVPVEEGTEGKDEVSPGGGALDRKRILCYLIHLRHDWTSLCFVIITPSYSAHWPTTYSRDALYNQMLKRNIGRLLQCFLKNIYLPAFVLSFLDSKAPNLEKFTCTMISGCYFPVNPSKWIQGSHMSWNLSPRCQETPNILPVCDPCPDFLRLPWFKNKVPSLFP